MTNPFAILALHAFNSYNRALTVPPHTLPKALLYTVGTTILATVIYKSIKHTNAESYNFLSTFLKPFHDLFNRTRRVVNDSTPAQTPLEDKYFKEYDEWIAQQSESEPAAAAADADTNTVVDPIEQKHKKECLENMYYSTVREPTNDFYGDVIMCYDHATLSFAYYARTANIPYKYLETISRKYMIETNAPREIHVDIRNEYKRAKDRKEHIGKTDVDADADADADTDADAETDTKTDDTVFVKLKSYNTASNLNLHTTTNDTTDKTHKFATTSETNTSAKQKTRTKIIRERANRYSYRGKINDFAENHRRPAASVPDASESVSTSAVTNAEVKDYAEFKRQMIKTRSAL
jgi:hypothetical protein